MALQPEIRTDSLAGQLSDSLPTTETALRESIFRLRDSLATIRPAALPAGPPVAAGGQGGAGRTRTAEELFGAGSTLAIEPFPTQSVRPIYESAPFQGIVLALVFAYLVIIYHNLREVYILCRKLSLDRSKPGRMTDTQGSTYTRFLWAAIGIGLPMLALLTLRLTDRWFPIPEVVPEAWIPVLGLLATVGLAVLLLFQVGLLRITGYVTLSRPITDQLVALKFNYLALSVVFLCPLILLFLLASPDTGHILSFGILILGGALLLLYLKESLMLFLSKKISILHWFLYLCAVEIFPVSFVWLSLTRI